MRSLSVRCIYMNTETPVIQVRDDETVVTIEHEGNDWWVYVTSPAAGEAPWTPDDPS